MLTAGQLRRWLDEGAVPDEARLEVWYPSSASGQFVEDVDVAIQDVHDNMGTAIALAFVAARPRCAGAGDERCARKADVELVDRTGHRHRACVHHATEIWNVDRRTRINQVYGAARTAGWAWAVTALWERWPDEPTVREWTNLPAPWDAPLPEQPLEKTPA